MDTFVTTHRCAEVNKTQHAIYIHVKRQTPCLAEVHASLLETEDLQNNKKDYVWFTIEKQYYDV